MNTNTAHGMWSEIKGKIRTKWAKLTDDDVEGFKGNLEKLSGKLEKTYGYTKERAEREFNEFKSSIPDFKADFGSGSDKGAEKAPAKEYDPSKYDPTRLSEKDSTQPMKPQA